MLLCPQHQVCGRKILVLIRERLQGQGAGLLRQRKKKSKVKVYPQDRREGRLKKGLLS
jgi:hypothetical protein